MLSYAIKRIALAVVILMVVMLAMYGMVFLVPGDPASVALGPRATPALKAMLTERMGLDQPVLVQVGRFFGNVLRGDLGVDVWSKRPVWDQIVEAFPHTMILGVVALGWALTLGIALGCLAVVYRGTAIDRVLSVVSVSFISVPSFVVAIYLLLIFAVWLKWLPAIGAGQEGDIGSQIRALILPSFAVGIGWVGYLARMVRASMLEVMGANHIRTARAFGLPERRVVLRYALRIAIVPPAKIVPPLWLMSAPGVKSARLPPAPSSPELVMLRAESRRLPVAVKLPALTKSAP